MAALETLWTAAEAAQALGIAPAGQWQAQGVSIDSRAVAEGDLFIAIEGEHQDGHAYVEDALARGAVAAMVHRDVAGVPVEKQLHVQNTNEGLNRLAEAARARSDAVVTGVTGSVGKTGAKNALNYLLQGVGKAHATAGNLNNHYGLPLTLARMKREMAFAVLEMGMNHAGEIRALTALARPHIAIITHVDAVHLEFFDSVAGIAAAKAEIMEGLEDHADFPATVILPRDNPYFDLLLQHAGQLEVPRILTFGVHQDADMRMISLKDQDVGQEVAAQIRGRRFTFTLPQQGKHHALNALATLCAVDAAGQDVEKLAERLAHLPVAEGRGAEYQIAVEGGTATLIDDSYNASPVAMQVALQQLVKRAKKEGKRSVAILGDMLELGKDAAQFHRELAPLCDGVGLVLTAGDLMERLHQALPPEKTCHAADAKALLAKVQALLQPGDLVLVKGSHGSAMWQLAKQLCHQNPQA